MSVYHTSRRFTPLSLINIFYFRDLLSLYFFFYSPFPVCWARGARPRGKLLYGQTWLETPDPVRSPKLSNHGRVQYSGGGPPGKRTYCTVSHHISVLPTSEVRTSESPGKGQRTLPNSGQSFPPMQGEYCGVSLLPSEHGEDLAKFPSTVELVFCLGDLAARRQSR